MYAFGQTPSPPTCIHTICFLIFITPNILHYFIASTILQLYDPEVSERVIANVGQPKFQVIVTDVKNECWLLSWYESLINQRGHIL